MVSAVLTFAPALAVGGWLANSPKAVQATAPAAVREAYVNQDFEQYYSSQPAAAFATEVYTNNVRVALLAFAGGILIVHPHRLPVGRPTGRHSARPPGCSRPPASRPSSTG